ncbi:MAG: hypothetical protein M1831_002524 [Alyxoria varia]|nr:MAG: hypothetical protein M1831_002524 [Alyxoria varia]
MASHVVVIDSSFRRHTIKTNPTTYMSDVLQQACSKLGLSADKYTLKNNDKPVDLSLPIRLANLNNGARLNLVQSSKSPSVVQVALQLSPKIIDINPPGTPSRLVDKFPSTTSLWQILRRFESGVAGSAETSSTPRLNFTQNARPQMANGTESGSGRLYYEMPVVSVMGREIASLLDLQKTLAQLGLNSGNVLMRFDLRPTEQPLDEAMADITTYFQQEDQQNKEESKAESSTNGADEPAPVTQQLHEVAETQKATNEAPEDTTKPDEATTSSRTLENTVDAQPPPQLEPTDTPMPDAAAADTPARANQPNSSIDSNLSIYSPPSNTQPTAADPSHYDPTDYEPTIEHAKRHQNLLNNSSRNRKLASDAELEASRTAAAERRAAVQSVTVRLKFPDESIVEKVVGRDETGAGLYKVLREVVVEELLGRLELRVSTQTNLGGGRGGAMRVERVDDDDTKTLTGDLGWSGRVMVMVAWKEGVNVGQEWGRKPCLKPEYRQQGQQLKVDVNPGATAAANTTTAGTTDTGAAAGENENKKGKGKGGNVEAKMKKFLGIGKK